MSGGLAPSEMDETADNGGDKRNGVRTQLPAGLLALVASLDRQIEELRRLAPPGYDQTIDGLNEALLAIHDAIDGPSLAKRR